jgi:hypothetical protein
VSVPDKKRDGSTSTAASPVRVRHALPVRFSSFLLGSVPTDKTFAYSEDDWRKIKASLARVGIDADAVTVGPCDRWWALPDPAAALVAKPQRPLREQLRELAAYYRGLAAYSKRGGSLTPWQEATEIRKELNKLEPARAALDSRLLLFIPETADAREALTVVIARAKRHVDRLTAKGSQSSFSARKAHIEYWGKLVLLWQAITADQNLQRKRGLNSFLIACSKPVFPEETSKSNINNFRRNYIKRPAEKGPVLPS